jgi:phage protein D
MKQMPTGEALRARAKELGVVVESENIVTVPGKGTIALPVADYELQKRVLEAERHLREHRLWQLTLASAIASAVSAVAAWAAVFFRH